MTTFQTVTFGQVVTGGDFYVNGECFYKMTNAKANSLDNQDHLHFDDDEQVQVKLAVWKPTQDQCDIIKAAAVRECGKRVTLEPGIRCSTVDDTIPDNINILLVDKSESEGFAESDLLCHATWKAFRKGVELTPEGRAFVDFYCYDRDGLVSNLGVDYDNGTIECLGTLGSMARDRQASRK